MGFCRHSRCYLEIAEVQSQLVKVYQQPPACRCSWGNIFDPKQRCFFVQMALRAAGKGSGRCACSGSLLGPGLRPSGQTAAS